VMPRLLAQRESVLWARPESSTRPLSGQGICSGSLPGVQDAGLTFQGKRYLLITGVLAVGC
jgi:hypothetical protein